MKIGEGGMTTPGGAMERIEPMTAAEYRQWPQLSPWRKEMDARTLAALEERERLLGERADNRAELRQAGERVWALEADLASQTPDAALGALVRRIREHPMAKGPPLTMSCGDGKDRRSYGLNERGLTAALSHLDSLLPKEPEVATGPSGAKYRVRRGTLETFGVPGFAARDDWMDCGTIPVADAPVVAKLMEAATHE